MLRFTSVTNGGKPLLFLGITGENVTRLVAGEPITLSIAELAAMGLPELAIVIHYGKTEDAIMAEFADHGVMVRHRDLLT